MPAPSIVAPTPASSHSYRIMGPNSLTQNRPMDIMDGPRAETSLWWNVETASAAEIAPRTQQSHSGRHSAESPEIASARTVPTWIVRDSDAASNRYVH